MHIIKLTEQYIQDYRREKQGRHRAKLDKKLLAAMQAIIAGVTLIATRELVLGSNLKDCNYYPIKPHLILIYRKSEDDTLELVRLGSHNELSA